MSESPLFDHFSDSYDEDLNRALAVIGAGKEFFAQGRVAWLSRCLRQLGEHPQSALDYGCGIGSTIPLLSNSFELREIIGVDISSRSLATAQERHGSGPIRYATIAEYRPEGKLDLAYCNGVFHHIPKAERPAAVAYVREALRPQGLFAFWENNPWSPATHYVMSRCSFDKDAVTLSVSESKRLLRQFDFTILRCDFLFIFPNFLRALQPLEPLVSKLALGAQYQILARKA